MNNSVQKNVLADIVTVKTSLNTNNIFKFDENWWFIVLLSVTPNWDSISKKKRDSRLPMENFAPLNIIEHAFYMVQSVFWKIFSSSSYFLSYPTLNYFLTFAKKPQKKIGKISSKKCHLRRIQEQVGHKNRFSKTSSLFFFRKKLNFWPFRDF